MKEENNNMELEEVRAMIYIPKKAVEIVLSAKVYMNGELQKVEKTIDMDEIREAIRDAEENYIGPNDMFQVTEEGLKWLEEQENSR